MIDGLFEQRPGTGSREMITYLFAKRGEVPFGMALAQEHRKIGAQASKVRILAVRACTQCATCVLNDLLGALFDDCATASGK